MQRAVAVGSAPSSGTRVAFPQKAWRAGNGKRSGDGGGLRSIGDAAAAARRESPSSLAPLGPARQTRRDAPRRQCKLPAAAAVAAGPRRSMALRGGGDVDRKTTPKAGLPPSSSVAPLHSTDSTPLTLARGSSRRVVSRSPCSSPPAAQSSLVELGRLHFTVERASLQRSSFHSIPFR